jgi:DNA-binding FadR family transcriptional regulator
MTVDPPALRRADWGPRPERKLARPDQAAETIARLASARQPGERLGTKDDLRRKCGVSVGTFNEALRMVQARGIVRVRPGPGGGLFVDNPSPMVRLGNSMLALDSDAASVTDAVRLRDAIDPLLVEDAVRHAGPKHIRGMRAELAKMKTAAEARDGTGFVHANWALHAKIAEVSPSPILRPLYLSLLEMVESHVLSVQPIDEQPLPEYIEARYQLHAALVEAIADGDPRALHLIAEHNTTAPVPVETG